MPDLPEDFDPSEAYSDDYQGPEIHHVPAEQRPSYLVGIPLYRLATRSGMILTVANTTDLHILINSIPAMLPGWRVGILPD